MDGHRRDPSTSAGACGLCEEHDYGAAQMDGAILVVSAADGPIYRKRGEHILLARQVGSRLSWSLNKADRWKTRNCWSWWSWKCGSCSRYGFRAMMLPVVIGSAIKAIEGIRVKVGVPSIMRLWRRSIVTSRLRSEPLSRF